MTKNFLKKLGLIGILGVGLVGCGPKTYETKPENESVPVKNEYYFS